MQRRTRVKFCGITRSEDAQIAVELGVDALGFVFQKKSPRYIAAGAAAQIVRHLPPLVTKVGLFVDADAEYVARVIAEVPIDLVQFHGSESPAFCERAGRPYVKAVRMSQSADLALEAARYGSASALLVDAYDADVAGGTGTVFEWERVPGDLAKPVILAGGLDASNVARAIETVRPFAVDVSTGIEREKGVKDRAKMQEFMQEVK
jgi:phosphoribosylanthranilate isomerase